MASTDTPGPFLPNFFRNLCTPKYLLTLSIYFCYFSNAINFYLVGPTVTSLSNIYEAPLDSVSLIFTIRTAFYTFGALSGFGFKYVNRQICLVIFTLVMGVTLGLLPLVKTMPLYYIVCAINGLVAGGSDTAITAWIIELWADKCNPYLDAMHFVFGAGSILAPLVATPFLDGNSWNLVIPYMICAVIIVTSGVVLSLLLFSRRFLSREINEVIETSAQNMSNVPSITDDIAHEQSRREFSRTLTLVIVGMGCLLMATYMSMEMTYFNFESVFAQSPPLNMSEAEASILTSVTSAVYAINRGVEIGVSLKISPHLILLFHFALILIFNVMSILTYHQPLYWVWISNIGIGIGCGSVYPTIYSFLQQNFQIDNKKAAILLCIGGVVGAVTPYVVGLFIVDTPLVLMYVNIVSVIICLALLLLIKFIVFKFSRIVPIQLVMMAPEVNDQTNVQALN